MLQTIRDYFSGIFSWIILVMVVVPFALWGINQYTDKGGKATDVALVNGAGISQTDLLHATQEQQARMREMLGASFDAETFNTPQFKRQVLDKLIEHRLVEQAAADAGLDIGDVALGAYIKSIPQLQRNGAFAPDIYATLLHSQGLSPAAFESRTRDSLRVTQLQNAVLASTLVSTADVDDLVRLREQRRDIAYLTLPYSAYLPSVKISDADISSYYDQHRDLYRNPEQVQLDYLDFSIDELAAKVAVDEPALRRYYDEQAATLGTEEQRRASHILITLPAKADAKTEAAARQTLAKIQERLKAGASFESLAKEYSQDKGSANKGGDLGFFGKGVMDKAFEDAVFKLQKGAISAPVRSAFGLHLIKLTDIKPAHRKSFEEARAEVEQAYRHSQAEKLYYDRTDGLADTVYEQPDSLDAAAKLLQIPVRTSDWLTRQGGAGVGAYPKVMAAAFSAEVLTQGNNSEPVEVAPGHVVVVRVKAHRQASQKPLAEVREQIIATLRTRTAQADAATAGKALLQRLAKGESLAALAAERKLTVRELAGVRRDDTGQAHEIVSAAFRLARPDKSAPRYDAVTLANGDCAVLALKAVHDGDPGKLSRADRLAYQRELQRAYSESEFQALADGLRAQAKIKVWEDKLN